MQLRVDGNMALYDAPGSFSRCMHHRVAINVAASNVIPSIAVAPRPASPCRVLVTLLPGAYPSRDTTISVHTYRPPQNPLISSI